MRIINNLRKYRIRSKLTQQQVLRHLGHASPSRLSAWENGSGVPSSRHLVALSELYRVPVAKLVGGYVRTEGRKAERRKAERPSPPPQRAVQDEPEERTIEQELDTLAELLVEAYFIEKMSK